MHIVIVGNGIAGITCARHIRKMSDHRITVISSESRHFFSRTALMYIYMGHMRFGDTKPYEDWFWEKNRIDLLCDHVTGVDPGSRMITLKDRGSLAYDRLVVATGSSTNMFNWPGQDLPGVQGLYSLQDLQRMQENTQGVDRAVIVGGGLIGIEMAEMLRSRNIAVTFLVRESSYWNSVLPAGESGIINRHIRSHGVELKLSTELQAIEAGTNGRVCAVTTKAGERIECGFVGLTAGVHPNIGLLRDSGIETDKGVLVNEFLETSDAAVFAAGDCVQFRQALPGRKPVEQVWYTGKMQGATLARTLCGKRTAYRPGQWFNSAKFFDIEYQVYGRVPAKAEAGTDSIYWESQDGEKCVRLVYDSSSGQFIGMNAFGIRYRHHLVDQWLNDGAEIGFVIENLGAANFDPEFYKEQEHAIRDAYNRHARQRGMRPVSGSKDRGLKNFRKLFKANRP